MSGVCKERRRTHQIAVGPVRVGGDAPISVQTMTKTDTRDVAATLSQIRSVAVAGCDIVRLAVPDADAAHALCGICEQSPLPVIADIHFDYRLALAALAGGIAGLRINPGNIGSEVRVREVADAAKTAGVPIRIGVNGGSLEKDILAAHGGPTSEALVASAMRHVAMLEHVGFDQIKISAKASDVTRTLETYRLLSRTTDYPLHLGVTEAGTLIAGTVRSSVAMGILLSEGIGDTIRISLTDEPEREVRAGLELLRALGLREPGAAVTSCPTCGRCQVGVQKLAGKVETALETLYRETPDAPRPHVAVMGCVVNGPGEAREADLALVGGSNEFLLYARGELLRKVPEATGLDALVEEVRRWQASR